MQVKLLLSYDVKAHRREEYYQYIIGEFLPQAQKLGLLLEAVWESVHGDYPNRLVSFVAKDAETARSALNDDAWDVIETRLGEYVTEYEKRLVKLKPHPFQFFIPRRRRQLG
jgi:hypothetical protein